MTDQPLIQRYLAQSWRMGQTDIANMLARIESDPELRSWPWHWSRRHD